MTFSSELFPLKLITGGALSALGRGEPSFVSRDTASVTTIAQSEIAKDITVILGFNTKDEIFYEKEFSKLGKVFVTTVDGSYGIKGFVTNALESIDATYFYSCGPEPMLKALSNATTISGELSFEERMGCGFGACMGCSCKTLTGNKRICKEGPVMKKEEIIW